MDKQWMGKTLGDDKSISDHEHARHWMRSNSWWLTTDEAGQIKTDANRQWDNGQYQAMDSDRQ